MSDKLIIRKINHSDLRNIDTLNADQDFKLPNISHSIVDRIVYDGDIVVAYGIVKKMAEAIMLVNQDVPKIKRAEAMRELMIVAEAYTKKADCQQLHVFVKNEKLVKLLEKQFGFKLTSDMVLAKDL